MPEGAVARHHIRFEELPTRARTAKADLKGFETAARSDFAEALDETRWRMRLSIKELAALLGKDMAQVSRWLSGQEPVQVAAVWSVKVLRQPFLKALAKIDGARVTERIEWEQIA